MAAKTRRLVDSYLDAVAGNAFFLVAIPASSKPSQSIALDIIRERRLSRSTVAVLTKCDLLEASTQGNSGQFQHTLTKMLDELAYFSGCVATMMRPVNDVAPSATERLKQKAHADAD